MKNILTFACLFVILSSCNNQIKREINDSSKPNFLIIIADDLGYSDIGPFGGNISTPVLDKLSRQSLNFSGFHVLPTCSPTRSALLTGNDNHVAGLGIMSEMDYPALNSLKLPGYSGHLSDRVVTIPELLKEVGYHTYMAGKWHLGEEEQNPYNRGFEEAFSLNMGGGSHWDDLKSLAPPQTMIYTRNGKIVYLPQDFYSSKNYTDSIISFIDKNKQDGKPFFAYLSYSAGHDPLHAPKDYIEKFRGKFDTGWDSLRVFRLNRMKALGLVPNDVKNIPMPDLPEWKNLTEEQRKEYARDMEVYAAMLNYMDMSIGRVLDYLKKEGLFDHTMILFFSDNGANGAVATAYPGNEDGKYLAGFDNSMENRGLKNSYVEMGPGWAYASSSPFRMFKSFVTEGGIKAPLIVKMPWEMKDSGQWNREFVHVTDIMPTILELSGAKYPLNHDGKEVHALIGKSIVPVLKGDSITVHSGDGMGYELFEMKAFIKGDWKLLRLPQPFGTGEWQLFNISEDPGETTDLSSKFPELKEELISRWMEYARQNEVYDHKGHFDSLYRKNFRPQDDDD